MLKGICFILDKFVFYFITFGFYLSFKKFFFTPSSQRYSLCLLLNVAKFLFLHSDMQYEIEIYFYSFPYREPISIPIYSVMISPMISMPPLLQGFGICMDLLSALSSPLCIPAPILHHGSIMSHGISSRTDILLMSLFKLLDYFWPLYC